MDKDETFNAWKHELLDAYRKESGGKYAFEPGRLCCFGIRATQSLLCCASGFFYPCCVGRRANIQHCDVRFVQAYRRTQR